MTEKADELSTETATEERATRVALSSAERQLLRRFDPGRRALYLAAGALLLILGFALPWVGDATGMEVLLGSAEPALEIGLLSRVFAATVLLFGVLVTALTLVVRRWFLTWICAFGCGHSVFEGMLAIWSRQTVPDLPGPGAGLIVTVLAILFITMQWFPLAWSRD
ncbi:Rv2732c family membrane protein [Actinoalloteichus hymeniacidonis]|uniref:Uncharacterized protein n=1 Tax=Actinoalloteichus hymeniacidonis TaxID=340345 RepID=A0AAC9HNM5_9PSEU|nr:hypothetical protein [Actinoalloteichus hymeniacidonis]AOS62523.1 hypothetical protein TL08_08540 [Actinoalloteichus hymeniacidonis]MBB5909446.1 uncharacterized membrane protein YhaH (DUF805 family) [Actinoalloteichus hymeniacidonis]